MQVPKFDALLWKHFGKLSSFAAPISQVLVTFKARKLALLLRMIVSLVLHSNTNLLLSFYSFNFDLALRSCAEVVEAVDPELTHFHRLFSHQAITIDDPRVAKFLEDNPKFAEKLQEVRKPQVDGRWLQKIEQQLDALEELDSAAALALMRILTDATLSQRSSRLFQFFTVAEERIHFALTVTGKNALFKNLPIETLEFGNEIITHR